MNELPNGWAEATLEQVTAPRGERADPQTLGSMPFVGMDHVEAHTSKLLGSQPVNELKSSVVIFKKGDLLYGRLRPYLNKVHLAEFDGAASAEFIVFPASDTIQQRFLQCLLRSQDFRTLADLRSTGDRPRVKFDSVSDFSFVLPPLAEQKRIVTKIDALKARTTSARTHLTAIKSLVEKYKASVLDAAFSGHEETVDFGALIDGIKAGKNLKCDERPPKEGERGTIKVSAVTWGTFRPDQSKTYPPHFEPAPDTLIKPGDFLISRANTIELVGAVVLVDQTPGNLFLSDKVLRIDMSEDLKPWLLWFLRSSPGRSQLENVASGNQKSMRNIGQANLKKVVVPLPNVQTRTKILTSIETSFEKIDALQREAEEALEATKLLDERILSKALAGELVSQDPTDEPASVLLDRIHEARANAPRPKRQPKKQRTMTKKPTLANLLDSWPSEGMTFEELRAQTSGTYDQVKEELFALMTGDHPKIRQEFDKAQKTMHLKKVAS